MITKEITTTVRSDFGKGPMRRLRAAGKTPGVVYGWGKEALPLEFETKRLFAELLDIQGRNAVITLKIDDGSERSVVVKEIQSDPVKDTLYHADFQEIDLSKKALFTVPLTYTGKSKGVELGGLLSIEKTEVVLSGLPLDIPDECQLDITELAMGDSLNFSNITLPDNIELVSPAEAVCVSVTAP